MKHSIVISFVCVFSMLLAACDKAPAVHSVDYYKQNVVERASMLDKCRTNPDLESSDKNCRNAADAEFRSGSFKPSTPKAW